MWSGLKVYVKIIRIYIMSGLEYRGWRLVFISNMIGIVLDTISIPLIFLRFGSVGEWTMERILFIYVLASTSYGFAKIFCVGFEDFPWKMVRSGDFDRVLLRPRSLFTQITGFYFRIGRIPWAVTGLSAIAWLMFRLNVTINFFNITVLICALIGGILMYTGIFIITAGIGIFTVKGLDWIFIFTSNSRQVAKCPIDYLPKLIRGVLTFVIPMFVISYYPASLVCGWGESAFTGLLALPTGIAFLFLSTLIWKIGVRHYRSTGS